MNLQQFRQQLEDFRNDSAEACDARLETECIQLLGRLEVRIEQISGRSHAGDLTSALESGKEMLVDLLEFITQRFGSEAVARDLPRICELRDTVRDIQTLITRGFWKKLFRMHSSNEELIQQAYRQVGAEFAELFRDLLSGIDGHFHASATAAEWKSSCRILIDDFRQHW